MKNFIFKKLFPIVLSIGIFFIFWFLFSNKINSPLILPSPKVVLKKIVDYLFSINFWLNFKSTFLRCLLSFILTIILGLIIGIISGLSIFFKNFFEFPLSVIRTTPVIALILIVLYWFNSSVIPIFVSILMTLPIIVSSLVKGLNSTELKLLEMAKIYHFSSFQIFKFLKWPAAIPYFINSLINSFGITWKVVVAGEVLCLPKKAIGTLLQNNQIILETADVLSITIILVTICFLLEKLFILILFFIKKHLLKEGKYGNIL